RETFVQAKAAEAAAAGELHQEIAAPELSVSTTPASEGGAYRVLGFIGAGVALAATGAGIAALVVRANHVSKYNDDALCLPPNGKTREQNCGAERSAASSAQRASIVGFGAAGVLAVTSIVFFAVAPSKSEPEPIVSATVGPGGIGVRCAFGF